MRYGYLYRACSMRVEWRQHTTGTMMIMMGDDDKERYDYMAFYIVFGSIRMRAKLYHFYWAGSRKSEFTINIHFFSSSLSRFLLCFYGCHNDKVFWFKKSIIEIYNILRKINFTYILISTFKILYSRDFAL